MVQIWTVLTMDGISPCSPWLFSTSDDPVSFFSTLSTVEGHQLLLHEAKCLAGALLHLDSLCTRPGVVLFCDLQGIIINSYMSQTVQVVLLRMNVGSIASERTVSISLQNLHLLVVSQEAALGILPMYRGLQLLIRLLLK